MGIETSMSKRKGKEFAELENEEKPILNNNPKPNTNTDTNTNTNSRGGGKKAARRRNKKTVVDKPIQKLYDTCKEVFSNTETGVVPSPDKIEKLRAVLDDIIPEDVGLHPQMPYFFPFLKETCEIIYMRIYECKTFSIGIFCFPPSGVIPLHNHPGMTVFSKLLFGKMHIKSYDWVVNDGPCNGSFEANPSEEVKQLELLEVKQPDEVQEVKQLDVEQPEVKQTEVKQPEVKQREGKQPRVKQREGKQPEVQQPGIQQHPVRLAKVKIDSDFTAPCKSCILYPADGGNMHCFTAATACAVLDVLGPPYSDHEGRHCTYYNDFPFAKFSVAGVSVPEEERECYAWLEEREKQPEGFRMIADCYIGPKIVTK